MTAAPRPSAEAERLEKRLARAMGRALHEFRMLSPGDRVMVAVSGGKDSFTLHHLLAGLAKRASVPFRVVAVHLDQGQPGYDGRPLSEYMRSRGYEFHVVREDTYSIVREKIPENQTYCSLCSRLRRAILYRTCSELGCTRLALGHHRDDAVVTFLLNLFFSGQLKAMPPKLVSDDGEHIVIRPLIYCAEDDIARFAELEGFPIQPCNLCGSQDNLQRKMISQMLATLERDHPNLRASALAALANVRPSHLFDAGLWQKLGLAVAKESDEGGDVRLHVLSPRE